MEFVNFPQLYELDLKAKHLVRDFPTSFAKQSYKRKLDKVLFFFRFLLRNNYTL